MAASLRASVSASEVVFITDSDAEIGSLWSIDSEAVRCMGTWRPFTNTIVPTPSTTEWAWLVRRRVGGTVAASHTQNATITEYSPEKPATAGGGGPHTHPESEVVSLVSDLAGKAPTHSHPYAATSHAHVDGDLPAGIARDAEVAAAYSVIAHNHAGTYEPAGTVATHAAAGNPHPTYATDADLTTHAAGPHGGSLPAGLIVMWGGLVANIPSGWVLCNGQNGTPDLRDRFIKGASGEAGATGGAATHTHADHAALTHSGATVGDHTLSGSIATEAAHTHAYTQVVNHVHVENMNGATTGGLSGWGVAVDTSTNTPTATGYSTANPTGGVASGTTAAGSAHGHANGTLATSAHAVGQAAQHAAQSHAAGSSEPAYFALCFIQKT